MKIERYISRYLSSNCYLISEGEHGILIDPCYNEDLNLRLQNTNITLDFALLTHEHADHISGVPWLKNFCDVKICCSDKCAVNIQDERMNYSRYFDVVKVFMQDLGGNHNIDMEPFTCHADETFSKDIHLNWENHDLFLKMTPGHSEGGICCLVDWQYLFCGDTLFLNQETVTRFKGGSPKDFREITVPWLCSLTPDITVYPGHYEQFHLREWISNNGGLL